MAEMEDSITGLDEATNLQRLLIKRVLEDIVPSFETLLKQTKEERLIWKERALKAEDKVSLLERQLKEKTNQVQQFKSSYQGQYQLMMKTGAVLSEVVWKSFKNHTNVKLLVQAEETMDKYCALSLGIIDSFLQAFRTEMPPSHSLEYVFMIGVIGALANLAAFSEGRNFLAKEENGLQLLKKLLTEQEHWGLTQGKCMKRIVLTLAYNMTLVDNVALFVLSEEMLTNAILKCLGVNDAPDVVSAAMLLIYRLLEVSFHAGIPSALPEKIPWSLIRSMTTSSDPQLEGNSKMLMEFMETFAGSS
uniref:Uncharacterized protein n=1 Tax=Anopheles atroparvus TaxID=41427 RepID=A0AAG5DTP3_ANOAO